LWKFFAATVDFAEGPLHCQQVPRNINVSRLTPPDAPQLKGRSQPQQPQYQSATETQTLNEKHPTMGRRPIIIPRHQSHAPMPFQIGATGKESLAAAENNSLAHPLALMNINGVEEAPSVKGTNGGGGGIGIRRHGQLQRSSGASFSTPEKKIRTRMIRKRSPTSILLPLDFIEEEEEGEDEEGNAYQAADHQAAGHNAESNHNKGVVNPTSVPSEDREGLDAHGPPSLLGNRDKEDEPGSMLSSIILNQPEDDDDFFEKYNQDVDEETRLSEIFDTSVFGSVIDHVDDSNDFGHDMVLPEEVAELLSTSMPSQGSNEDDNGEDDDRSSETFWEMMHQQNRELMHQQEEHFASMLTTSAGSSILTTSTLEQSLEQKRQKDGKDTAFQRILKAAAQNCEKNAIGKGNNNDSIISNNTHKKNSNNNHVSPVKSKPATSQPPLILPEDKRRVALARYRYNQIIHSKSNRMKKEDQPQVPTRKIGSNVKDKIPPVHDHLEQMGINKKDTSTGEDSFAIIEDDLRCLKDSTLKSDGSFRVAASYLSKDLYESNVLVKTLEAQLEDAKKQRVLCLERFEAAKAKRVREKELTAIQTLHLEILSVCGRDDGSRKKLLERHQHDTSVGKEEGVLGTRFLFLQQQQQQQHDDNKENSGDNHLIQSETVAPEPSARDAKKEGQGDAGDDDDNSYRNKSIEELRVIKNRLEAIKDLLDKARYMVTEESSSSSSSKGEFLRKQKQHQSKVMIETAASKYISFRTKNLV
jgi:hypothetical protein